jgi:hypothetical protein
MAKMFTPPKAPTVVTTTAAPVVTATPVVTTPTMTAVTTPAPTPTPVAPVVVAPTPAPVIDTTPKVIDTTATTTTSVVKSETDPMVAAEQALAKRDRSISGTVLTSWRGVLQPTASGSAAPARKRLLGE